MCARANRRARVSKIGCAYPTYGRIPPGLRQTFCCPLDQILSIFLFLSSSLVFSPSSFFLPPLRLSDLSTLCFYTPTSF